MLTLKTFASSLFDVLKKSTPLVVMMMVVSVALIEPAYAGGGQDAAAVAENIEDQVLNFKSLALSIAFLLGIVLFIAGLWMLYKDSKQPGQGHAKNGLIAILVGAGLLVVQTLVGITAESVTQTGGEATDAIEADTGF